MLLAEFVRETVASLVPLYGREEAWSIVSMLCGERLGVKSYTHIIEPGTVVDASLLPGLDRDRDSVLIGPANKQYIFTFHSQISDVNINDIGLSNIIIAAYLFKNGRSF